MLNEEGINIMIGLLIKELVFSTSRSSGPGGQHVNKVETKVTLMFSILASKVLDDQLKTTLMENLSGRISSEGILSMSCEETRSQTKNKEIITEKFISLVLHAMKPIKKRQATRPTRLSKELRLKDKKMRSGKKLTRRPPESGEREF